MDGGTRVGRRPAVGYLGQWVVVVAVASIQTASQLVEYLVSIATTSADEKIQVLICHLSIEAIGKLRLNISQYHAILLIDDMIAIDILELRITWLYGLDGLCRQLAQVFISLNDSFETVTIEGSKGFAYFNNERIGIAMRGDKVFGITKAGHLVFVVGDITACIPTPLFVLEQYAANLKLYTFISHRADITQYGVETCHLLHRHIEQQVTGLLIIAIEGNGQTIVEETGIKADIIRRGGFPLQVWIRLVANDITRGTLSVNGDSTGVDIGSKLIVADFLITHDTY